MKTKKHNLPQEIKMGRIRKKESLLKFLGEEPNTKR